jgi:elongation factor Ts
MNITAQDVKDLRDKTGAKMMDCKKALTECNGDMEAAIDYLREKGITKAAKKQDRIAAEGLSNIYIDGNKAVIVEVNSETDFVAKNAEFKELVDKIGTTILNNGTKEMDKALELDVDGTTIKDLIIYCTAKIGEKYHLEDLH